MLHRCFFDCQNNNAAIRMHTSTPASRRRAEEDGLKSDGQDEFSTFVRNASQTPSGLENQHHQLSGQHNSFIPIQNSPSVQLSLNNQQHQNSQYHDRSNSVQSASQTPSGPSPSQQCDPDLSSNNMCT